MPTIYTITQWKFTISVQQHFGFFFKAGENSKGSKMKKWIQITWSWAKSVNRLTKTAKHCQWHELQRSLEGPGSQSGIINIHGPLWAPPHAGCLTDPPNTECSLSIHPTKPEQTAISVQGSATPEIGLCHLPIWSPQCLSNALRGGKKSKFLNMAYRLNL